MTAPGGRVRTFIAVLIPPVARQTLADCIQQLSGLTDREVRWVNPEGIHLTLRFLGDIPVERVDDVLAAQQAAAGSCGPFSLQLSGLGMFPNSDRPRVLWAGASGDTNALQSLQQSVEEQLEIAGWPRERRPFAPHLTLGRVRDRASDAERKRIAAAVESSVLDRSEPWVVVESHLIRSTLTPQGAIYTSLGAASLSAAAP